MKISPTLQEALALRSAYKLPQALAKLEEACKLNEPDALFVKGMALMRGGWGLHANFYDTGAYVERAENFGFVLKEGTEFLFFPNELVEKQLNFKVAERINDASYWYYLGKQCTERSEKIYAFKKGADQCHEPCIEQIQNIFGEDSLINVKYIILGKLHLQQEHILKKEGSELIFQHLIGKAIFCERFHPLRNSDLGKKAVTFYLKNIKASEMEVITWLLISKCLRHPRDTSKLIALEIWRLRDEIWL